MIKSALIQSILIIILKITPFELETAGQEETLTH